MLKKYLYLLYLRYLTLQDVNIGYVQKYLAGANKSGGVMQTECQGSATIDITNLLKASFLKSVIK